MLKRHGDEVIEQARYWHKTDMARCLTCKRIRTEGGGYRRDSSARSPGASKSTRKTFSGRKANCCTHSSPLQAKKRRVLACPVLYRSGAPRPMKMGTTASP
jgi:hypothetical protein